VPEGFTVPEPRRGYVRPDTLSGIAARGLGAALRAGAGAVVAGYTVRSRDGKLVELSTVLPETRPALPLVLYEFEACPFCKKVREALSMLDLDVVVKPCPKGGTAFRKYVKDNFGKAQFPYLVDPNTDFSGYESGEIIKYLFATYGGSTSTVPFILGPVGGAFAGFSAIAAGGRGLRREAVVVPAPQPLELWAYEPSPFCRVVRERLCELEIPYLMHSTPRGSPNRQRLRELTGRIQVPYLVDPNTGIKMFESAEIVSYLTSVYGPEAPGAVADPAAVYLSDEFEIGDTLRPNVSSETSEAVIDGNLNPPAIVDPVLEDFCETSPDADECRTYDT
jgi:glutathione S-transferase